MKRCHILNYNLTTITILYYCATVFVWLSSRPSIKW